VSLPSMFSYLSAEDAANICKLAEEKKPGSWKTHLRHGAGNALAFGAGSAAGAASGLLANKIYAHYNKGQKIPLKYLGVAAPVIGGLLASAYQRAHSSQEEDINRALANPDHHSSGRLP
jgi:hypothetical protein